MAYNFKATMYFPVASHYGKSLSQSLTILLEEDPIDLQWPQFKHRLD